MKILFPSTSRVHRARQQILLRELQKIFEVDIEDYPAKYNDILNNVADIANHFRKVVENGDYDLVLIRGDRYELLPVAMIASYRGIRIAHLEGGDVSGAVDNKVRKAITGLSDLHFATNKESYTRLINMGTDPEHTFNFGSLDVEYAKSVGEKDVSYDKYVLMCHHPMPREDAGLIERIVRQEWNGKVIVIKSNSDNGTPYGKEEYSPEEYIKLIANAKCLVGNSSSFLKEASAFGTPVVNIGERQRNRLKPHNVKDVPFNEYQIRHTLRLQLQATYEPSTVYWQENTSLKIVHEIDNFLRNGK